MKPLVVTENCFSYSMGGIDVKEEPLQDDLVSILLNRSKLKRN